MVVKKEWNDHLANFTVEEMACKKTGGYAFHPEFAKRLQILRFNFAEPMHPTSCCRSEGYNSSLGNSSPNSLHIYDNPKRGALGTCAVDLYEPDSQRRAKLLLEALKLGFSFYYINKNPNSIHIDLRASLGEDQVAW